MNMPPMPDIRPECKKRRQVEKVLQDTFQDQQQRIRNMHKESGHALELQVFGAYQSRRSEAIVAYIDEIRRRFLADYPDLRMEQDYIRAEILSIDDYDMCEDRSKFITAAALWVLDELKREDKLDEAYKLLPDEDEAADAHSADIYDSIHPQVTINAMAYAIQYRNEGLQNEDDICYIVDEGTARKRKIESNFRKIIALLDPQIISDVTKRFEEDIYISESASMLISVTESAKLTGIGRSLKNVTAALTLLDVSRFQCAFLKAI